MTDINGYCVVVTGAGKGIGRATAKRFAEEGANVFAVARTEDDLESLEREVRGLSGKITPFVGDVTNEEKIHLLFEGIRKWVERMDVLVNAAGIGGFGSSVDYPLNSWRQMLDVNLTGSFICAKEAIRLMTPQGNGLIVNLSSIAGKRAFPQSAAYSASKWGVRGMSLSLSEELRGTGIRVTALCPGATDTPIWDGQSITPDREKMLRADEVAEVIVSLAKGPSNVSTDEIVLLPPHGVL